MVRLSWRLLWQRPAALVGTFVAVLIAVVAVTAFGITLESGARYHGTVARYAGAPVVVGTTDLSVTQGSGHSAHTESFALVARPRVPSALPTRIEGQRGVRAVVGDTAVSARVGGVAAEVHPWSAAQLDPFRLVAGAAPSGARGLVLDDRLATALDARPGATVHLELPSGSRTVTVAGIARARHAPGSATAFVPDETLRSLAGDAPQVLGVLPDRGTSTAALAAAVGRAMPARPDRLAGAYPRVTSGAARGSVESLDVDDAKDFVVATSSVFGASTLVIATFVIAGTVGLSVRQRHRDIAVLRLVAATPAQIRRAVIGETTVVGLLAGAAGVWPGIAGAGWLHRQLLGRGLVPGDLPMHVSWLPPLVAIAAAVPVAVGAAWAGSLRTSRIRPIEALAESALERTRIGVVRLVLGVLALTGGVLLCVVATTVTPTDAPAIAVATIAALTTAVALLSPVLIRGTAATVGRLLRVVGVTGRLAAATTSASANRLASVVSSLVLAVALSGSLWFVMSSAEHVATEQSAAGLRADRIAAPAAPGLAPEVTDALTNSAGVAAGTGLVHSTMFDDHEVLTAYTAQGIYPGTPTGLLDLDVTVGNLRELHGASVALDNLTAEGLHLSVGESFHGWFGDGSPTTLQVVAIYRRGLGFAQLTVPRAVLLPHTASGRDDAVLLDLDRSRPDAAAAIRQRLAHLVPGTSLVSRAAYRSQLADDLVRNAWADRMLVGILVAYVAIGAANTLVMSALGRRRELATLQLSGTTRRQVLRMVGWESTLTLGVALVFGVGIAAATLAPIVLGVTGTAVPYIPVLAWPIVLGGAAFIVTAATLVPVVRMLRTSPVQALGVRE